MKNWFKKLKFAADKAAEEDKQAPIIEDLHDEGCECCEPIILPVDSEII